MKHNKKYFALLPIILILFVCACTVKSIDDIPFTDVPEDAWYYEDVRFAYNKTLINGRSETTFAPDEYMTYAEAIKLAACMHQVYTNDAPFVVSYDPWYEIYVDYCYEKGIISHDYDWNQNITRGEYMDIFSRALPKEALQEINTVDDGMIPDIPMSYKYATSIYLLYRAGIVQGQDEYGTCAPESLVKRCEVAAIMTRMMDETKRVSVTLENPQIVENEVDSSKSLPWEDGGKKPNEYTWDEFQALDEYAQEAFFEWFASSEEFEAWMNSAKSGTSEDVQMYPWENGGKKTNEYTWDEFQALDEYAQEAFVEWFASSEEFEAWMNSAKSGTSEDVQMYPWENGGKKPNEYTWDEFQALDEYAQEAFFEWFASSDEFEAWMNSVS